MREEKRRRLKDNLKLYAVTDEGWVGHFYPTLNSQIEACLKGGVTLLQLREKDLDKEQFLQRVKSVKPLTEAYGVPLIINDSVEICQAVDAEGVHLGQDDFDVTEARRLLGEDKIIGVSAHNVEEALAAQAAGADYLGVGSVFATGTKKDARPLPSGELRRICDAVEIPVVAIGGIGIDNVEELAGTGVFGAAIVSDIFSAMDIEESCRVLAERLDDMLEKTRKLETLLAGIEPCLAGKKGIIFDMDGTLLDSLPMWSGMDVAYMARFGITPDADFHHQVATMTLMDASEYIAAYYKIPRTPREIFDDFQAMVMEEYNSNLLLKPLAKELVKTLWARGYRISVATANEKELSVPVLRRTGLSACVTAVVSCTMAGADKTKPDVYLMACEKMGVSPEECVVFEDSVKAMETARKAGFTTVGVYDDAISAYWEKVPELTDGQVVFEL